jgi:hypothetical protein
MLKVLRDTNQMTEDMWLKVVGDPIVKPPVSRLLDLGITQNAIWDLMKALGAGALVASRLGS